MDITEMLGILVTDLKMTLDSEISTAEGTRAIKRAVDELSRHVPRERIYEHTWIKAVTDDSFTIPATESDTTICNAVSLNGESDGATLSTVGTWLDVPRPLKLTVTDANNSIVRMTVIVKGTDADGVYREERFYRHNGKIQTGKIYFPSILQVVLSEVSGNGAGDTLSLGTVEPDLTTRGQFILRNNTVSTRLAQSMSDVLRNSGDQHHTRASAATTVNRSVKQTHNMGK